MSPRPLSRSLLIALVLVSASLPSARAGVVDRLEASVNSNLILHSDLRQFRKTVNLRSQLDPLFAGSALAQKGAAASDEEITQFMIDERIIAIQFPISDSEVEQEVTSIQTNNRIDRATLRRALAAQGYRFEDYFELIRVSSAKRNLIDREIRAKVVISDDDVRAHMGGGGRVAAPTTRSAYRLGLISVSLSDYQSAKAAKEVADRAKQAINSGESFEDVRRRVNGDDSTGELGPLPEDQISPLIRAQLKKLKPQQVSAVFGGAEARGYYLIKLLEVTSAQGAAAASGGRVDEAVRNQLAASEYTRQIKLWLERQRATMFVRVAGQSSFAAPTATPSGE